MFSLRTGIVIALALVAVACREPAHREYRLRGQILAMDQGRQEVTIKHEDIPQFMPAMTMTFKVSEARLLEGRRPGDLVTATLIVSGTDARLETLERTGFQAVAPADVPVARAPVITAGDPVADAQLQDEQGHGRRLSDWRGHVLAVTFIYTRCPVPSFCPLMDRHFRAVQDEIKADSRLRGTAKLLSISFDPDHDTPEVLSQHAARLGADPAVWSFLTGTPGELKTFAGQFGVSILPDETGAEIVHNLRTAVIDPAGRLVTILNGNQWTPPQLVEEMRNVRAGR
jgi:protein SCO1/2